jgi:hypothetical protein
VLVTELTRGRRIRRQVLRQIGHGLQTRPLLTILVLLVTAVALATAVTVFVFAAILAAIIAALGFVAFTAGRELLQPMPVSARTSLPPSAAETRVAILRKYLAAVDEFTHLTDLAMSAGIDEPPRGGAFRYVAGDAHHLRDVARGFARRWRGSTEVAECMYQLEAASAALQTYIAELQRTGPRRASAASLRWRREDLGHRRDALATRLRETDFRAAAG